MPPQRRFRRRAPIATYRRKLRRQRKRKTYGVRRATVGRLIGNLQGDRCRMRYVESLDLVSPVAGAISNTQYYCNGLWDPRVAVGGHQPMGFDNAMNYFQFAIVTGAKITVKFSSNSANTPLYCGIYQGDNVAMPYVSWTTMKEIGMPMKILNTNASGSSGTVTVTCKFSHKKFFGQSLGELSQTANSITANAIRVGRFNIWIQPVDETSASGTIKMSFNIDYTVRLYNPVAQQQN